MLDSANTGLNENTVATIMYAGAPSRKFETLSFAKEISPTGEGVNHVVKRGEVQIVQKFNVKLDSFKPFNRFAPFKTLRSKKRFTEQRAVVERRFGERLGGPR